MPFGFGHRDPNAPPRPWWERLLQLGAGALVPGGNFALGAVFNGVDRRRQQRGQMPPPVYGVPGFGGVPSMGTGGFGSGSWGNPSGNPGNFNFGNGYQFNQTGVGSNGLPTTPNVSFGQNGAPASTPGSTNGLGSLSNLGAPNQLGWTPISNNGFSSDHGWAPDPYADHAATQLMMNRIVQ
jgi:hypothetical protein